MSIKEKALEYHQNGYNCAQSVIAACSEYTGLDEKTALAISAGFGGGARSGELCGAISGAIMSCGMAFPFNDSSDTAAKNKIAKLANQCVTAAKEKYGNVRCFDLKCNGVSCPEIIGFMAEVAEEFIKNN